MVKIDFNDTDTFDLNNEKWINKLCRLSEAENRRTLEKAAAERQREGRERERKRGRRRRRRAVVQVRQVHSAGRYKMNHFEKLTRVIIKFLIER